MTVDFIEKKVLRSVACYGNIILVLAVVSVFTMMVLPLPTWVLDFMLTLNIVGAITLLLIAISVSHSMKISAFPTLLLVATLFRLGLNIASTRLILSKGYAGHIIETFGHFAISGNLAVGLILFLIITLIQFIVIAKGSERVAEVAARFTLDALPGKQMSIDADLRAGIISQEEARSSRDNLHRESKLYGSMDGAMKFVKGDAIAGIIITVINILGGLSVGVLQRGLSITEAIQTYSLLTIGDGLVSQIPALLISMTAGFVITRVADEKSQHSLGTDIGLQILSQPKALIVASVLTVFIGFMPGFPFFLFLLVALILAGSAFTLMHQAKKQLAQVAPVESYVVQPEKQITENFGMAVPLTLEVGEELYRIFKQDPRWTHCFGTLYSKLKLYLSHDLGVLFPEIKLSVNPTLNESFRYQIRIYEVPVDYGILNPHHCARIEPHPTSEPTTETVHGTRISLWDLQKKKELVDRGFSMYGPEEMLLRHLARVLKRHAGDFIGIQEMRTLLNQVESQHPELVREVVPKMMSLQKMTEIVKRLVEEGISIRDFRLILETLSGIQPDTKDPITLTEQVRIGLKRTITFRHTQGRSHLQVMTIHSGIEDEIRGAIQKNGSECYLALPPHQMQEMIRAFKEGVQQTALPLRQFVVLTHLDVRRYFRKLIEEELPELAVLSYQELDPKVMLNPLGEINYSETLSAIA